MILCEILSLEYPILAKLKKRLLVYNEQFLAWKKENSLYIRLRDENYNKNSRRSNTHFLYFSRPSSIVSSGSFIKYTRIPGIICLRYDSQSRSSMLKLKISRSAGFMRSQRFITASLQNRHCCDEKYDITELNLSIFAYAFRSL